MNNRESKSTLHQGGAPSTINIPVFEAQEAGYSRYKNVCKEYSITAMSKKDFVAKIDAGETVSAAHYNFKKQSL